MNEEIDGGAEHAARGAFDGTLAEYAVLDLQDLTRVGVDQQGIRVVTHPFIPGRRDLQLQRG